MPALLTDDNAPRSIITLAEAQGRVRADLGLTDSSLLTDANLTAWLNEAQDLIALHTRWFRIADTLGTTADTKEYSLPTPAAGRCIQIEELRYDDEQLELVTMNQLRLWDWNYAQAGTGRPQWYYMRGNNGFGLHVTPDTTDADILTVIYVARPPHLSADEETFYVPHGAEYALLIYAKALASEKDIYGEGARRAGMFREQWEQALARIKRQVDQVGEREQVVLGSDALDQEWQRGRVPFHTEISF